MEQITLKKRDCWDSAGNGELLINCFRRGVGPSFIDYLWNMKEFYGNNYL